MSDAIDPGRLLLVAAAVLVDTDGRVLVQQRPPGKPLEGMWEFPGGKVEADEQPDAALVRELREELGIVTRREDLSAATFVCEGLADRQLLMLVYLCRRWQGVVAPLHASALRWCHLGELHDLPMPPADAPLIPIIARLL